MVHRCPQTIHLMNHSAIEHVLIIRLPDMSGNQMPNVLLILPSNEDSLANLICSAGESMPDTTDLSGEWKNKNCFKAGEKHKLRNKQWRWDWNKTWLVKTSFKDCAGLLGSYDYRNSNGYVVSSLWLMTSSKKGSLKRWWVFFPGEHLCNGILAVSYYLHIR